jgi:hypothetical protein
VEEVLGRDVSFESPAQLLKSGANECKAVVGERDEDVSIYTKNEERGRGNEVGERNLRMRKGEEEKRECCSDVYKLFFVFWGEEREELETQDKCKKRCDG